MKINEFLKALTDAQIDALMGLMNDYGWNVTEAVMFGYDDILAAK